MWNTIVLIVKAIVAVAVGIIVLVASMAASYIIGIIAAISLVFLSQKIYNEHIK